MSTMKNILAACAIFLVGASLAMAEPRQAPQFSNRLFTEIVQMTQAGLADATIIAYVKARRSRLETDVSANDLIRLRQAGVSENVVGAIAGLTGLEGGGSRSDSDVTYDSREAAPPPDSSYGEDEAYAYPNGYPYWYAYGYPYWGYPYWYGWGPSFSTRVFIGGRSFRGGRFGHGGFGHGGGHGGFGGHGGSGGHGGGHGGRH